MSSRKAAGSRRNRYHKFVPTKAKDYGRRRPIDSGLKPDHKSRSTDIMLLQADTQAAAIQTANHFDPTAYTRFTRRAQQFFTWKNKDK